MHFNTPEEFANYFGRYLKLYRPDGIYDSVSIDQYVSSLKNGGYFTDNYDNYLNGVKSFLNQDIKTVINNGLNNPSENFKNDSNFKNSVLNNDNSYYNRAVTKLTEWGKKVGYVLVGLVLLVFGVFLLTKDNKVVMSYAKKGDE